MKKFHQTIMSTILDEYETMRSNLSLVTVFHLIQYFKCKNILELGFYQGQTFGIMIEAAVEGSTLTAVDINYILDLYNKHYKNSTAIQNKKIILNTMSSLDFKPDTKYDFINVDTGIDDSSDGDLRYQDLINSVDCLEDQGILMLDNYELFDDVIDRFLSSTENYVPFLKDNQAIYFHHCSHDVSDFLDNVLEKLYPPHLITAHNIEYKGHTVKELCAKPMDIETMNDMFIFYCNKVGV